MNERLREKVIQKKKKNEKEQEKRMLQREQKRYKKKEQERKERMKYKKKIVFREFRVFKLSETETNLMNISNKNQYSLSPCKMFLQRKCSVYLSYWGTHKA